jgi:hypothetical protein
MKTKISEGSSILISDLLVGEHDVMNPSAMIWGLLYKLNQKYAMSLIARLEGDKCEMTEMCLPLFKMVAGFAQMLQEHTNKDKRLLEALGEAEIKSKMRRMFGEPPEDL